MSTPVIIDFIVKNIPEINRALRGVAASMAAAERAQTRDAQRESAQRLKLVEKEEKAKTQATDRAEKARNAIRERSATMAGQWAAREVRAQQRADRESLRSFKQSEAEKTSTAAREAKKRADDEERELKRSNASRERFAKAIVGSAARGVASGMSRIGGLAGQVGGVVAQLGGGFSIADSVQRGTALKGKLADIASRDVAALGPGKTKRKTTAEMEGAVRGVSAEFGIDADAGASALDEFASKTGDLGKGMEMLRGLGELSRAGVGSLNDLGSAAAEIFNTDKTQSAEQVLQKLRQFAVQGAKGSVEMKNMASGLAAITAAAGRFEGGSEKEMVTFGALAQLAKESGGAKGPREALTAVSALANQFGKNARVGKMNALGVDPKTANGFNRPVEDVLMDLMLGAEKSSRKGGKGLHDFDVKFGAAIASSEAQKATNPLTKAFKTAGGGAAGVAAAKAELAKFGAAGRDLKSEFSDTAKARTGEADAQMAIVKEKFDAAVSTKIIPALLKLVPEFEKLVPLFVELNATAIPAFVSLLKTIGDFAKENESTIKSIAAHPFAAIIGASLAKSVGSSVVSEMAGAALSRLFGKLGGGNAGAGALGVGTAAAAGALTAAVFAPGVDAGLSGQVKGQAHVGELISDLKHGTPEQKKAAAEEFRKAQEGWGGIKGIGKGIASTSQLALGLANQVTGGKNFAADDLKNNAAQREIASNPQIAALVLALNNNTAAQSGKGPAGREPAPAQGASIATRRGGSVQ